MEDTSLKLQTRREYKVVKANEIVQRAKYDLSLSELKLLSYIFSQIKPDEQVAGKKFEFTIKEYAMLLGIDDTSGKNYKAIKDTLKRLRDKSFWLLQPDGSEIIVGWISTAEIRRSSGKIAVWLDPKLSEYLTSLIANYTQYELLSTLPMQSSYSIRIYELLKSYAYQHQHEFDIDELKQLLMAQRYTNFKDFRRKVIEVAVEEINKYTDIEVTWDPVKQGRKVTAVHFDILQRDQWGSALADQRARDALDNKDQIPGQMNITDYINDSDDVDFSDPDRQISITSG